MFKCQAESALFLKMSAQPCVDVIDSQQVAQNQGGCDGEYKSVMDVWKHNQITTSFTVPADAKPGDWFNLVLEVSDQGAPSLTRCAQVIVRGSEAAEKQ
jgi:hypothetical protein